MKVKNDYPADWNRIRKEVYSRDRHTCQNCGYKGGPRGDAELHAHHIVPKSKGGTHNKSNLQTVCKDCHNAIHGSSLAPTTKTGSSPRSNKSRACEGKQGQKHIPYNKCPLCENNLTARDTQGAEFSCDHCRTRFVIPARTTKIIKMDDEYVNSDEYIHTRDLMGYSFPTYIWEQFSEVDDIDLLDLDALENDLNNYFNRPKVIAFLISIICVLIFLTVNFGLVSIFLTPTYMLVVAIVYDVMYDLEQPTKNINITDHIKS